jgi:hypothetical protein
MESVSAQLVLHFAQQDSLWSGSLIIFYRWFDNPFIELFERINTLGGHQLQLFIKKSTNSGLAQLPKHGEIKNRHASFLKKILANKIILISFYIDQSVN